MIERTILHVALNKNVSRFIRGWYPILELRGLYTVLFEEVRSFSNRAAKDRRPSRSRGRFLASALGLLPWRRSRHTKSPFARGRSGTFEFRAGPSENRWVSEPWIGNGQTLEFLTFLWRPLAYGANKIPQLFSGPAFVRGMFNKLKYPEQGEVFSPSRES